MFSTTEKNIHKLVKMFPTADIVVCFDRGKNITELCSFQTKYIPAKLKFSKIEIIFKEED